MWNVDDQNYSLFTTLPLHSVLERVVEAEDSALTPDGCPLSVRSSHRETGATRRQRCGHNHSQMTTKPSVRGTRMPVQRRVLDNTKFSSNWTGAGSLDAFQKQTSLAEGLSGWAH